MLHNLKRLKVNERHQIGGEGGIRTLDTLPYTHFPGVLLRPLGHLSSWVATQTSHTPAHESAATVAPFRAWRSSQLIVARGPEWVTIEPIRATWLPTGPPER